MIAVFAQAMQQRPFADYLQLRVHGVGPFAPVQTRDMKHERIILSIAEPELTAHLMNRLHNITGFVTCLFKSPDFRPLAFSRYYHVRRVACLSHYIASERLHVTPALDFEHINLLAWLHDINRWVFAHNSEGGLFDQAEDIGHYLQKHKIELPSATLTELRNVITKQADLLSDEGKVVLLADIVAGYIEDPLLTIVGLDVTPEIVPDRIADYLNMPLREPGFRDELFRMNLKFFRTKTPEPFMMEFDKLFHRLSSSFLQAEGIGNSILLGTDRFESYRIEIKERFMRQILFQYNAKHVSKRDLLLRELVLPYCSFKVQNAYPDLNDVQESEFLDLAVRSGLIEPGQRHRFLPELDYPSKEDPSISFRRSCGEMI